MTATITPIRDHAAEAMQEWRNAISRLEVALADYNQHKDFLLNATEELELLEARVVLTTEGRNEGERRSKVVLALNDSPEYQRAFERRQADQGAIWDAERRIEIAKQQCRLAATTLALLTGITSDAQ